jgi:predicted HAD superfamily phosphohydrolase
MAQKQFKSLNPTEIKKQVQELKKQGEFFITINGEEYLVEHDEVFLNSKIHKVLDDLIALFQEGRNRNELMEVATPYTTLLIIKHFTSIEVSDDIDEALELMTALIDLEVVDKIINALPEAEVVKMYEKIAVVMNNVKSTLEDGELEAKELEAQLKTEQAKKLLTDGE